MDIKKITQLLNVAKMVTSDLMSTDNKEERKQALKIQENLEKHFANDIKSGEVSKNSHDVRVFIATHKELFDENKKPDADEVTDYDYDFHSALCEETYGKEKELFLYTKALADVVNKDLSGITNGDDAIKKYFELTKELDLKSNTLLMFFLKYYWCRKVLESIDEINSFNKKDLSAFNEKLNELNNRMKIDLSNISFIVTLHGKELEKFQKVLNLASDFSKKRLPKIEAYMQKKLDETIKFLVVSMAS